LTTDGLTPTSLLWRGLAVFGLVGANAFFVAAEFALVASRRTRIDALAQEGDVRAKAAQAALRSLDRYISGTQLGITLATIALGWIGEPAVASAIEGLFRFLPPPLDAVATHAVAVALAFSVITFLHIVLGELAPKALALLHPEATSRWVAGPLIAFTVATNPFIWLLNGAATLILRMLGVRAPSAAERVHRPEELVMLAQQSHESGLLAKGDVRMIEGVFEFTEKNARDVMTPRTSVVAFPADMTVEEAARRVAEAGRSRYPVYGESLDEILGFVHAKQILANLLVEPSRPLSAIVQEVLSVPGAREVEDVLADMKRQKRHLAVVLDEYGGTAGIVTMEDLLEEIVGKIYDEYDRAEPGPRREPGGVVLPGSMSLEDANERFKLGITDEDYRTLGGYVFGSLGRLPEAGDRVPVQGGTLEVLEMDGRRVGKLRLVAQESPSR
jgi:CBS domain containing-hemolysin-like protein